MDREKVKMFTLISKETVLPPDEKVISSKDFSSLQTASNILKQTKKEAAEYREEVIEECELLKETAYKEGFQMGLEEFNKKILQMDAICQNVEEETQKKILPIALKAAKKILGEELKLHPERIVDIVIQALKPLMQQRKIIIYVNKDDLLYLEEQKQNIKSLLEHVEFFSIQERDDVEKGGCIIETEVGIVNAQLENQWKALEIAFEQFNKRRVT